jgi:hypothetical protein
MAVAVLAQRSCARAWVEASLKLIEEGDDAYDVLIEIADPVTLDAQDVEVVKLVNSFLAARGCGENPISTVSNTLFPQSILRAVGPEKLYETYHEKVFAKLKKSKQWGRYFERMTSKIDRKGKSYNPLQKIIEKLKKQAEAKTPFKAAYELPIYDPAVDRKRYRNAPCLSHLSFKRRPGGVLSITAVYRNQTYITRCLGNLIGLGRLQKFVADQAGLKVGTLSCLSTHAELDTGEKWGIRDARKLVQDAAELLAGASVTAD